MQRATRIFYRKRHFADGSIAELTLWSVPQPVRGSEHVFRYRLFYGRPGERRVLYDNEPGKGDHRHYGDREELYEFTTPEQLIRDFLTDVRQIRRGEDVG
jgi:Family of unknown function (DUF6516)